MSSRNEVIFNWKKISNYCEERWKEAGPCVDYTKTAPACDGCPFYSNRYEGCLLICTPYWFFTRIEEAEKDMKERQKAKRKERKNDKQKVD